MAAITATFTDDGDVQSAVDALGALGIDAGHIRIITPAAPETPDVPDGAGDGLRDEAAGVALAAGLAGLGVSAGSSLGASAGMGYPAAGAVAGIAAGALLSEAFGQLADLRLDHHDAELYRRRLGEGATILVVHTDAEHVERVAEELHRHHAADLRGI